MCPSCQTDAPLVYRGIRAYCSGCGRERIALSASSVTYAGKPAHVGGFLVRAVGWVSLLVGLSFSTLVSLIVWVFGSGSSALGTFGVMSLISMAVFWIFRTGGKRLEADGDNVRDRKREQAIYALAQNHGGIVQASHAANALDLPVADADAFLTTWAKSRPEEVGVEISDRGEVLYTFSRVSSYRGSFGGAYFSASWSSSGFGPRVAEPVSRPQPQAQRVRVETSGFSEERAGRYADEPPRKSDVDVTSSPSPDRVAGPPGLEIVDADFEEIPQGSTERR